MIYGDVKTFLQGHTEYLTFMYGKDFRLRWQKKFKRFQLYIYDKQYFSDIVLATFYTGDLKDKCLVNVFNFENYDMFSDYFYELGRMTCEFRSIEEELAQIHGYEVEISVKSQDQLRRILEELEEVNFFGRWK